MEIKRPTVLALCLQGQPPPGPDAFLLSGGTLHYTVSERDPPYGQ